VPHGRRCREKQRYHDDRILPAHRPQQRIEKQASPGRADQVEEIDAVHTIHALGDGQRNDNAGDEEWQRGSEKQDRQPRVSQFFSLPEDGRQREHHEQPVQRAQPSQLQEHISRTIRHHIGEHAARAQSEQRDRDGQKREVVKQHHRKDARER
jgi:hypothetical protein